MSLIAPETVSLALPDPGLLPQGALRTWGTNVGSLKDDTPEGADFVAVTAGILHGVALRADGSLVSWGEEVRSPSGENTGVVSDTPPGNDFVAVIAGMNYNSFALRSDGSIAAWGRDADGFGNPGPVSDTPSGTGFISMAHSGNHGLALQSDGSIEAWGFNHVGQVSQTPASGGFIAVAAASSASLALDASGQVMGWGSGGPCPALLSEAPSHAGFVSLTAGSNHAAALHDDGSIAVWGCDFDDDDVLDAPTGNDFVHVDAGSRHTVAIRADGSVAAWGANFAGQVGDAPTEGMHLDAAAGGNHTIAIFVPVPDVIEVEIRIRPLEDPNPIRLGEQGVVTVAILTTPTFSAPEDVDAFSLTFGATGNEESLRYRGDGTPACGAEDVTGNGLEDLVCRFHTPLLGFSEGDVVGILKGLTTDGDALRGEDSVWILTGGDR
jgi:alpha-tubulin suppressor-like RCC1 family protein